MFAFYCKMTEMVDKNTAIRMNKQQYNSEV